MYPARQKDKFNEQDEDRTRNRVLQQAVKGYGLGSQNKFWL